MKCNCFTVILQCSQGMEDEKTLLFLSPALLLAYANMINNMEIGESRHPSPPGRTILLLKRMEKFGVTN